MNKLKIVALFSGVFLLNILLVITVTGFNNRIAQNKTDSLYNIDPNPSSYGVTMDLYFIDINTNGIRTERRKIPNNNSLEELLITELIAGPDDPQLDATFPSETNLLSVDIINNIAFVNFSRDLQSKYWGGQEEEKVIIMSLIYTMTQLDNVDAVQILIEGERLEYLWDYVMIFYPLGLEDIKGIY